MRVEPAFANPIGGVVTGGAASISSPSATTLQVNQQSERAVIDWRGFDIAPGETTQFIQPDAGAVTLNRVNSNSASQIDGKLTANGNIVIINQNGVVFGSGAKVDANSIVVSTADTDNNTFMAGGKLVLNKASGNPNAAIINQGTLTAKDAGLVGLVAPDVENSGIITARLGRAQLASGDTATVDLYGDGLLEVAVSDQMTKQLVKNTGTISADGGVVALTAATGRNIVDSSIQAGGVLMAQTVNNQQGTIIIASATSAARNRDVIVTAKLDASGKQAGQKGGSIQVLGDQIALMNGSLLNASGVAGGGEILVGGDYHGGLYRGDLAIPASASAWGNTPGGYSAVNGTATGSFLASLYPNGQVPTASRVFVDSGVSLLADATGAGNGGRVIVWSDNGTVFNGFADVGAYGAAGNGGFIETSGEAYLQLAGSVNARAANGVSGTWLLDPADITISVAADNTITAASPFGSTGGATSNLSVATLVGALNGAANVIISSAAGAGGLGNVTFTDAVSWNSVRSLTVNASNNITVNNTITNAGTGDINLNANVASTGSIAVNSAISTGGNINMVANQDINISAGLTGAGISLKAANGVTSGTGNLNLAGNLTLGTGPLTLISGVNGARPNWTADTTTLSHAGSFGGAVDIEGFNTLTINRPLALTTGNNLTLANDTLINLNGNLSTLGAGTISLNGPVVLPEAAAITITTGGGAVSFGGTVTGTAGGVDETLSVNSGSGTTTFTGALNVFDPTVTAGTISFGSTIGSTTTMGPVVLTAANALTLPDITATSVTITTTGAAADIAANGNITSAGAVVITAFRDLTEAVGKTITAGGAGALTLKAANGSTAGTGNLNLNGNLVVGTGAVTLYSGVNGARPNWTASATTLSHAGSFGGAVDIEGFGTLTLSRALALTAGNNLTLANNTATALGANLSTLGTGTITLSNPATIAAGTAISITTANQPIVLNAITGSSPTTSTLTTNSGTAATTFGTLNDFALTATANNYTFGGTMGATTAMGAVTINDVAALTLPDITAASVNVTSTAAAGDITTGNITSAGLVDIISERDLTVAAGKTVSAGGTGALTLEAANGSTAGTGNLVLTGNIGVGTGALTLYSGINGARPSWTANTTTLVNAGSFGPVDIEGFNTLTIARAITMVAGNSLSFANNTALTLGGNLTTSGTGTISITNPTTIAAATAVTVTTANQPITFSNTVTGGSGTSTLTTSSGTATTTFSGNLNNFGLTATAATISFGGTLGATTAMGPIVLTSVNALSLPLINTSSFSATTSGATGDINVTDNLTSTGQVVILAFRDLTETAAKTITAGGSGLLSLKAANGSTAGTGNLNLNGALNQNGTGGVTLYSGVNGTRPSWTADGTTLIHAGSFGGPVDIEGFTTLTINRAFALTTGNNLLFTNNTATVLNANLSTLGTGTIIVNGPVTLPEAAAITITTGNGAVSFGGTVTGTAGGVDETLNINSGTGTTTFTGALNLFDPTVTAGTISFGSTLGATTAMGPVVLTAVNALTLPAITASSVNVTTTGATGDITVGANITSTGDVIMTAFRALTVNAAATIASGATGNLSLKAANGVTSGTGALTLSGNLNIGTGNLTLYSGTTRPNWTPTAANLIHAGSFSGNVDIEGFGTLTLTRSFDMGANDSLTIANNTTTALGVNLDTTGTGTITVSNPVTIAAGTAISITTANEPIVLGNITGSSPTTSTLTTNSGTAATTFGLLNDFALTATANNYIFGGAMTAMGAVTINDVAAVTLPDITAATVNVTSTGAAGDITTGNITSTGLVDIVSDRDLTVAAAKTVTAGGAGALTLEAANGNTAGTGDLNITGNVGVGTGNVTLYSGLNPSRPSWAISGTTLVHAGNFGGTVDIEGFNVLTLTRAIGLPAGNNLTFANNTSLTLGAGSGLSTLGTGTINITNPVTIAASSTPTVTTANQAITFGSTITGTSPTTSTLTTNSGTATTTFTGNLNDFALTSTADTFSFGGTLGQSTGMGAVSLTGATGALTLPAITAISVAATTTGASADITVSDNMITSGTAGVVITSGRDLTLTAAKTITTASTGPTTLKAAGGSTSGTGNLNLNGNLSGATGAVTLYSGINGTRPNWTATTTTMAHSGSFGAVDLEGFGTLTINRAITTTAGSSITIANNTTTSINSNLTAAGTGTITISNPLVLQEASALTFGTTNSAINISGTVDGTAGGVTESLTTTSGTGTTTFGGAVNGITLASTAGTFALTSTFGATTPMVNVTFTSSGALTIPNVTLSGNFSATNSTAATNIIVNGNIQSSGGNINIVSKQDLTENAGDTIASGPAGTFTMEAANNVVTGTGNLNLNGDISAGTGAVTLLSGVNGTRPNWTADGTTFVMQGASFGALNITGLGTITLNRNLTSSGLINIIAYGDLTENAANTITNGAATALTLEAGGGVIGGAGNLNLNGVVNAGSGAITLISGINGTRPSYTMTATNFTPQSTFGAFSSIGYLDFIFSRNFTSNGAISVISQRDLNVTASDTVTPGSASALTLEAANNAVGGTGNLNISGTIAPGTGAVTLSSGANGVRPNVTITTSNFAPQGATIGALTIQGFLDTIVSRNITSNGSVSIISQRDVTVTATDTITTGAAGALTLEAANNGVGSTGNLNINGNLSVGSGALALTSGINGTRPSIIFTTTNLVEQSTLGAVTIQGFLDTTLSRNLTSSGNISVVSQRDLTQSATYTVTPGSASNLTLEAANNVTTGTGNLNLNGTLAPGTGTLTLTSGANGTRPNYTMTTANFAPQGATVGVIAINGLQDTTISRNLTGSGNIVIVSSRDLTVTAGDTITPGAAGLLTLEAAGGTTPGGTGNLTINGNLAPGSGNLTLYSGINVTRPSWTATTTNFTPQSTVGVVDIQGFLNFVLSQNLTSTNNINIIAQQDATITSGFTLATSATGALTLAAANNNINGTGNLNINGNLAVGTGAFTLTSGLDAGVRANYSPTSANLTMLGATFGPITWQGFGTLSIGLPLISSGAINFGNAIDILSNDVTSSGAITFPNAVQIAEGKTIHITSTNSNITFSNTLDGTAGGVAENVLINAGTGTVNFTSAVGSIAPLGNLSVIADNLTLSSTLVGTGALIIAPSTAGRAVNLGTATTDSDTTAGLNLTTAENGRIGSTWSSVTFGNLTSGAVTNNYAAYTDPVNFLSGNDFTNAVATTDTGPIFIQAVRDVALSNSLTTSDSTANAIVIVAGRNFLDTAGAGALTTGAGGRWLVYSTDPTDSTGIASLSNNFNRYSCTYGGSCPTLGSGNGLLYTYTPVLNIVISNQTYNYGDAMTLPTAYTLQSSGYLNALDSTNDVISGSPIFQTSYTQGQHAGSTYSTTNNGSTLVSSTGYGLNYVPNTTGVVGTRAITVTAANQTQVYGFGGLGTTGFTVTTGSLYGTDAIGGVTLSTNATPSSASQYNVSAVGTPWTIGVSGATFSSGIAGDYAVTYAGAPIGLIITQKALTVSATGTNKVYDGLTTDTVTLGDNRIAGDVLTLNYGTANFSDKNVGNGKAVSVGGITVTGTDSANYSFNTTASTTANITQKALTVTASGINKIYDGLATATVTLGDNRVSGDTLTLAYGAASFPDKNVGNGRAVSVSGITVTGTDSGNYTFNTTAATTANITQKALTVSATGINKVYDALTTATVTLGDDRVAGDTLTIAYGAASFADKNAANGKAVSVSGITVTGADSANYSFNTTASTTANITQKALTVSATGINKVYDGLAAATVTLGDDRIAGDVLTLGYGAASFPDKNVGNGRAVSVSGITVTGADSGNYSFNTTASTTANITAKALTVTATGINKVYDGLATATVTLGDNRVSGDTLTLAYGAASFPDKNVGNGRAVSVSGITVGGADAGNYTFNTTASTTANITQKALMVSATGINKVYDGLTGATVTLGDDRVAGDTLTLAYGAASFADKNVANGKAVSVSGITVTGTDSGNYSFNATASTTANITQKALTVTAAGINKVYDGLATATVTLGDNRVSGDTLTLAYGAASFPDKNVGNGRAVSVSGITIGGADAGNYSFNTTASTTANITTKALTVSATGIDKVYDGLAAATVTLGDNRIAGDTLTLAYGAASFPDKNVGNGRAVSVSGITVTGADSGNYTFNTTASTTANITQKVLTVTASGIDKVYDGLAAATVTLGDNRVAGDTLTLAYGAASFPDKNVGNGRAVSVSGITVTGTDSGNYSFNTTASTTANITQKALTVTATGINKVYDGLASATVTLGDNRVSGDTLTLAYGAASFPDKNVGNGRAVSVSGITLGGADSGNYTFNTTASTTANITQKALTVTATGTNKTYDGLTNAVVTLGDNVLGGDTVTLAYGAANFSDKNAGTGKTVNVSGITTGGADAGNYSFNMTATTTADIAQKALTVSATGVNKVYDGLATATVTLGDDRVAGDTLTLGYGAASFPDKNVGNGLAVSVSGITVTGTDSGNYSFNTTAATTANITQKALTVSATGINKVYDGLADATVNLGDNRVSGDALTLAYGAASFADKNAANGKAVSVGGITVTGTDAGNYTFNATAATTANITKKALSVSATGVDKVYDGSTVDTVTLGDDRVAGDTLTLNYTAATFGDKNVANGKAVSVSGITVGGADAGNYTFNATAATTADITPKALTVSASGINKVYDGLTGATVTLGDDRVAGDALTLGYGSADFADKNVANGKAVSVGGITVTGADAGNYTFNATAGTTANITPKALSVSATAANKVYDGLATASVVLGDNRIAGDVLTLSDTGANFTNKNAGNGKTVNVSGITVGGGDAGNYTFNATATTTANITQKALTVSATATNKVYDGLTTAGVTLGDDRVAGDTLTLAYSAANFSDKNAANGKAVSVSGITVTGADSGNYSFNTTAATTADITQKALTVTATGINKVYDGLAGATVNLGDNRVSGDALTIAYGSASYADKNVANGKAVSVAGITVGGADAGNYTFNATAATTANITAKALTVTASSVDKVYDGLTAATVTLGDNRIAGDVLTLSDTGANFTNKNAGNGKTVNVSGITVGGADAGNYTFNTTATTTANITQKALTVSATGVNKVYNGLTTGTVTLGDDRVAGDTLTLGYGAATFADKNAANGKAVSVSGITVTGADAGNYTFNTTAATTANITQKALTVTATGINKVYNGLATATVTLGDNRVAGDALTIAYGSASFADKNAANGKAVSVAGITVGGADAGNYTFNATAATTANITQRALTVSATSVNKVYDGLMTAGVTLADNRIAGDVLTLSDTGANFANKNAGNGKTVTVSGISVGGADAGNYTFNTTATTTANITQKALTITASGINKVYDGLTAETVTLGDNRVAGDALTLGYSASFGNKNVGNGKAVSVSGITLGGADAGNYTFNTTAATTANITQRALTVGATGVSRAGDGTSVATIILSDNRVSGDILNVTYGAANFADSASGINKPITVTGINVTGADAGNYTFNVGTTAFANIGIALATLVPPTVQQTSQNQAVLFTGDSIGTGHYALNFVMPDTDIPGATRSFYLPLSDSWPEDRPEDNIPPMQYQGTDLQYQGAEEL